MKTYYVSSSNIPNLKPNVSCIGNFDASHKGHQALYKKTISLAKKYKLKSYLITFKDDPNTVLFNEKPLYSLKTRLLLYKQFGFDGVIIIKTNKSFYKKKAQNFIDNYLKQLNIEYLVTGTDFKFGSDLKGNNRLLKKNLKNVVTLKTVNYKGKKISTNRIKKCINSKDYKEANRLLGYEFKK